jgi:hypothetical protein
MLTETRDAIESALVARTVDALNEAALERQRAAGMRGALLLISFFGLILMGLIEALEATSCCS